MLQKHAEWRCPSHTKGERAHLARADLAGADLAGADLAGAHLAGADLYGADLAGAHLAGVNLAGADLAGANLSEADHVIVLGQPNGLVVLRLPLSGRRGLGSDRLPH